MPGKIKDIKYETLLLLQSKIRIKKHSVINDYKNLPQAADILFSSILPQKLSIFFEFLIPSQSSYQ